MRSVALGRVRACALLSAVLTVAPALAPTATRAETAPSILQALNRERTDAGLPHALTLDAASSAGCKLHDRWMARNHTLSSVETAGSPGYTAEGAAAGRDALIAAGTSWRQGDPWRNAPIQHALLLTPGLNSVGAAESRGYSCITVTAGSTPVVTHDTVWTYPAPGQRIAFAQRAREQPLLPQTRVGIRRGAVTGPYLDVFAQSPLAPAYPPTPVPLGYDANGAPIWGPDKAAYDQVVTTILGFPLPLSQLTHATLENARGRPLAVRVIDNAQLDSRLGAGNGFVLPVHPLKPGAHYRATVTLSTAADVAPDEARTFTYHWAFSTSSDLLSSG